MKDQKEKWLKETGYILDKYGYFRFAIRLDDYRATNCFTIGEVSTMPFELIKEIHADFIERAERKEIF